MRDSKRERVDDDDLPAQFTGIVHRCTGAAVARSIVNGQKDGGMIHHVMVPIQHTSIGIILADIISGIGLLQNSTIPRLR